MKLTILLECVALVVSVHGVTFRVPLISVGQDDSPSVSRPRLAATIEVGETRTRQQNQSPEQAVPRYRKGRLARSGAIGDVENDAEYMDFIKSSSTLQPLPIDSEVSRRALPLWAWDKLTYTAPLSIGTPPQHLNVLLSLSASSLLVASSACTSCCSTNSYISWNSSTHVCQGVNFTSSSRLFNSHGNLSQDTIHLGPTPFTTIKSQFFGEVEEIEQYHAWSQDSWDGVLGLAPGGEMGLLENMMVQNLLDRNLFSLKLPRGNGDKGEILFGDIDHDFYVGELISLPLLETNNGMWAVSATSLTVNDGEGLVFDMEGGTAVLETEFPFIGLPEKYVRIMDEQLGMENAGKPWDHTRSIDCSRRKMLHNITIILGGEEFVLSPWEYTVETDRGDLRGGKRCVSAFVPNDREGNDVVLGSAFLRAFYGVFELDRSTVSLARATSQRIKKSKVEWEEELRKR